MVGHGARALLDQGAGGDREMEEALVERGFAIFLDHYARAHRRRHPKSSDGLDEALDELEGEAFKLAVCTNKLEGLAGR